MPSPRKDPPHSAPPIKDVPRKDPTNLLHSLHKDPTLSLRETNVISSTKINAKVTQVLAWLDDVPRSRQEAGRNKGDKGAPVEEVNAVESLARGNSNDNGRGQSVVAISAKAPVANKLISIVEIVKRTLSSSPPSLHPSNSTPNAAAQSNAPLPESTTVLPLPTAAAGTEQVRDGSYDNGKKRKRPHTPSILASSATGPEAKKQKLTPNGRPEVDATVAQSKGEEVAKGRRKEPVLYQYTLLTSTPAVPKGPAPKPRKGREKRENGVESGDGQDDPAMHDQSGGGDAATNSPAPAAPHTAPGPQNDVTLPPPDAAKTPQPPTHKAADDEPTDTTNEKRESPDFDSDFETQKHIALPNVSLPDRTTIAMERPDTKPLPPVPVLTIVLSTAELVVLRGLCGLQLVYGNAADG